MRGQILSFDEAAGTGLISGDDGLRYTFVRESVSPPATVTTGLRVDFVPAAEEATNIMFLAAAPASVISPATPTGVQAGFDFGTALFSFQGRLRRQHFWIGWLICLGVGVVAGWIPFLGIFLSVALIWPNLAIAVKRFHDMGQTGWLIAIPYAVITGGIVYAIGSIGVSAMMNADAISAEDPAAIVATFGPALGVLTLVWLVGIGFWLWLGLGESQRGDNRFGPNPKGL
jgi:uncharacterized membrane protein YhaH (DUF805 family)